MRVLDKSDSFPLFQVTYQHKKHGKWITTNFHSEARADDYVSKLRDRGWEIVVKNEVEIPKPPIS